MTWDPTALRWDRLVELERYPRGLVVDGHMLYVGESANRGDPDLRAAVAVVEKDRVVDRIPLPCREVYDIVVAPSAAVDGLRRGFNTNPHRVAAAVSEGLFSAAGARELFASIGCPLDSSTVRAQVSCPLPERTPRSGAVPVDVQVTNLSKVALASAPPFPVCLSYRWTDRAGATTDGPRTILGRVLLPNDSATYPIELQVPEAAGDYRLAISLVQDGLFWFDDADPSNGCTASVTVT